MVDNHVEKIERDLIDTIQKNIDEPAQIRHALKRAKKAIKQLPRHRSATQQLKVNSAMKELTADIFHRVLVFLEPEDQLKLARILVGLEDREKTRHQKTRYFDRQFKRIVVAISQGRFDPEVEAALKPTMALETPNGRRSSVEESRVNWRKGFRSKDELEVRPHPVSIRSR